MIELNTDHPDLNHTQEWRGQYRGHQSDRVLVRIRNKHSNELSWTEGVYRGWLTNFFKNNSFWWELDICNEYIYDTDFEILGWCRPPTSSLD